MKPIIVSGIQPTGRLHLGNYLGALKNFVDLQNSGEYECFFFIADYHSITTEYDPGEKQKEISDLMRSFLAVGLDPKKSNLFLQSAIPEHLELAWIFNSVTPMGELSRMTQYKEKSEKSGENVGLFTYPVLQAADILIYDADKVPVGEDQLQHVELTRLVARKFNNRFGRVFKTPEAITTEAPRLMSLDNPEKKMSKSLPSGCVYIDESPEEIKAKFVKAVTDSGDEVRYDEKNKPGVSNLLRIASSFSGKTMEETEKDLGGNRYGELKERVGNLVVDYFAQYRNKKAKTSSGAATKAFTRGGKRARKLAENKMRTVRKSIGIS
ncbi:MAG: tryptophan--tRNA ligase [Candidatus Harrisonbacteria bacterium CG10_big_fil_rev_8_21_14_0_10_44_23]|uniref:Tryptophan--tRNA ligase n=1 Tax=Candidatus Harrisonbacteria bacterium CG10_big_fil_rev_8_21_14_0_10_44_23 TaxID=1974585 RepID=A0A2H0UQC7_9BACT|nr:MAG: tryptophan--tRNA ligase [Candidatus Harrisonbacteria bacterium CG10_big_fil_rev_8_21_14_0_10_44_23]